MNFKVSILVFVCLLAPCRLHAEQSNSTPALTWQAQIQQLQQQDSSNFDWVAGELEWRDYVKVHPDDSSAWCSWGKCLYTLRRFKEAAHCFQQAIDLGSTDSEARLWGGYSFMYLQNYRSAESFLREYIRQKPDDTKARGYLCSCLIETGKLSEAETGLRQLLDQNPDDAEVTDYLGFCLARQRQWSNAITFVQKAIALDGEDSNRLLCLGSCQMYLSDYTAAANTYRRLIALAPGQPGGSFGLGMALCQLGQYPEAAVLFKKAIRDDPGNIQTYIWLAHNWLESKGSPKSPAPLFAVFGKDGPVQPTQSRVFWTHLAEGEPVKAWLMFPVAATLFTACILEVFLLGTALLYFFSFRRAAAARPGVLLYLAWHAYYWDAQLLFMVLTGLLTSAYFAGGAGPGLLLGSFPLLAAGLFSFPKKSWGAPFRLPQSFPWKLFGLGCVFMILANLLSGVFTITLSVLLHTHFQPRNFALIHLLIHASPVAGALVVAVVGPLAEEILFRGLLFGALAERCGKWTILITAMVFAAFHRDVAYFVPITVLGLVLGWIRWKSGSIWLSFPLHAINNAIFLVFYMAYFK